MAITTKFNSIAQTFCAKIGDPIAITTGVIGVGKTLTTVAQIEGYVNRAMKQFFAAKWDKFNGDLALFVNFFPELIVHQEDLTIANGVADVSSCKNIFKLFGCRINELYTRVWEVSKYSIAKSGKRLQYIGSATHPGVILKGLELEFFGANSSSKLNIDYIQRPVQLDGSAYVSSADGEDSPFYEHWEEAIAQIANELYNTDAQNNS